MRKTRAIRMLFWPLLLLSVPPGPVFAQESRPNALLPIFIRPDGHQLRLLLRVPLFTIPQISFPQRTPGVVDLSQIDDALLPQAANLGISDQIEVYEDETLLPEPRVNHARVSLLADRSFENYEAALAHLVSPRLPDGTEVTETQGALDVELEYPIESDRSRFSVRVSEIAPTGMTVLTTIRFLPPSGVARVYQFLGDPGVIRLDPRWNQAVSKFFALGFLSLLDGMDYLLLLFCMILPLRRSATLLPVLASFTLAHALALIVSSSTLGPYAPWLPSMIQSAIAAAIVLLALENIIAPRGIRRRCIGTFGFGLLCGLSFSFGFRQAQQFAGSHWLASLLSFHAGVEAGQLLVLALVVPMVEIFFKLVVAERIGTILLSALAAHTGWHRMFAGANAVNQMGFRWPALPSFIGRPQGWFVAVLICASLIGLAVRLFYRRGLGDIGRRLRTTGCLK